MSEDRCILRCLLLTPVNDWISLWNGASDWHGGYNDTHHHYPQDYLTLAFGLLINSLWPSDTMWRHISGSTLAQVMVCYLTAPSHYLNQCWLIISDIHLRAISQDTSAINHKISLKITYVKCNSILLGANELSLLQHCCHGKIYVISSRNPCSHQCLKLMVAQSPLATQNWVTKWKF